jgi:hypothetical protein
VQALQAVGRRSSLRGAAIRRQGLADRRRRVMTLFEWASHRHAAPVRELNAALTVLFVNRIATT